MRSLANKGVKQVPVINAGCETVGRADWLCLHADIAEHEEIFMIISDYL